MTQYVHNATVYHLIDHLDHVEGRASTHCGREGQPVEANPPEDEVCRTCLKKSPHHDLDDEGDEGET